MECLRTIVDHAHSTHTTARVLGAASPVLLLQGDGTVATARTYYDAATGRRRYSPQFERLATPGAVRTLTSAISSVYAVLEDGTVHRAKRPSLRSGSVASSWAAVEWPEPALAVLDASTRTSKALYMHAESGRLLVEKATTPSVTVPVCAPVRAFYQNPASGCATVVTTEGQLVTIPPGGSPVSAPAAGTIADVHHTRCHTYLLSSAGHVYCGSAAGDGPITQPAVFYEPDTAHAHAQPPVITRILRGGAVPVFLTAEGHAYADRLTVARLLQNTYDISDLAIPGRVIQSDGSLARIPLPGPVAAAAVWPSQATFLSPAGELYAMGCQHERNGLPAAAGVAAPQCVPLGQRVCALAGGYYACFIRTADRQWWSAGLRLINHPGRRAGECPRDNTVATEGRDWPAPAADVLHAFYPVRVAAG